MAKISHSKKYRGFGVIICLSVVVSVAIGVGVTKMDRQNRSAAATNVIPEQTQKVDDVKRIGLSIACLEGVQYWETTNRSHGKSLTPKYSPRHRDPDTCD